MGSVQNKCQVFVAKTKLDTKKQKGKSGRKESKEVRMEEVKKRDDLQLFWVPSRSMKLTSCHA